MAVVWPTVETGRSVPPASSAISSSTPAPPKPRNGFAIGGVSPVCTANSATPKVRRTSLGNARMSRRLDAIQTRLLGCIDGLSTYIYYYIEPQGGRPPLQPLPRGDLDPEPAQAHISMLARRQQPDRADAEVLQNLRAEADLAPRPRARRFGRALAVLRQRLHRHAGGAVAQHHDHAAPGLLEARERGIHALRAAEHVLDDVGAVQPRRHVGAVADAPVHQRHVMHLVERRHIAEAFQRADGSFDVEL